jgi:PIN domain nuclease of toxin-antitoxin system
MRLLIDTHILIWFLEGSKFLSKPRRRIIADPQNDIFVSITSLREIAIKISLGKLTLSQPLANVIKQIAVENIEILSIAPEHTLHVSALPFHHRDPFDRIIICQA